MEPVHIYQVWKHKDYLLTEIMFRKLYNLVGMKNSRVNNLIDKIKLEQDTHETILDEIKYGIIKDIRSLKGQEKYEVVTESATKP